MSVSCRMLHRRTDTYRADTGRKNHDIVPWTGGFFSSFEPKALLLLGVFV